jgi:Histidine phosphotransferase C-terminal domain
VRVEHSADALTLAVDGRRTQPPQALWANVTEGSDLAELRPDAVQFPLLRRALAAAGHRIEARFGEGAAEVTIALSPVPAEART